MQSRSAVVSAQQVIVEAKAVEPAELRIFALAAIWQQHEDPARQLRLSSHETSRLVYALRDTFRQCDPAQQEACGLAKKVAARALLAFAHESDLNQMAHHLRDSEWVSGPAYEAELQELMASRNSFSPRELAYLVCLSPTWDRPKRPTGEALSNLLRQLDSFSAEGLTSFTESCDLYKAAPGWLLTRIAQLVNARSEEVSLQQVVRLGVLSPVGLNKSGLISVLARATARCLVQAPPADAIRALAVFSSSPKAWEILTPEVADWSSRMCETGRLQAGQTVQLMKHMLFGGCREIAPLMLLKNRIESEADKLFSADLRLAAIVLGRMNLKQDSCTSAVIRRALMLGHALNPADIPHMLWGLAPIAESGQFKLLWLSQLRRPDAIEMARSPAHCRFLREAARVTGYALPPAVAMVVAASSPDTRLSSSEPNETEKSVHSILARLGIKAEMREVLDGVMTSLTFNLDHRRFAILCLPEGLVIADERRISGPDEMRVRLLEMSGAEVLTISAGSWSQKSDEAREAWLRARLPQSP
jgi:hypothetical protein